MSLRDIAPFVLDAEHGFVYCVEYPSTNTKTSSGEALVCMFGMLHGTVEEMCAQVDYVMRRAQTVASKVCAVIDASHTSFRFPDHSLRSLFRRLRHYESALSRIVFCNMPSLVRLGFRAFALPLIDRELRERFVLTADVAKSIGCEWPPRPTAAEWLAWRAREEDVNLAALQPRAFDASRELASSRQALAHAAEAPPLENALYAAHCEKRGSGGLLGNRRWRHKEVELHCPSGSALRLVYRDTLRGEARVLLPQSVSCVENREVNVRVVVDAGSVDPAFDLRLRFADREARDGFVTTVSAFFSDELVGDHS